MIYGRHGGATIGILLLTLTLVVGCSDENRHKSPENVYYLKDVLGGVVLNYQKETGEIPEGFEQALVKYKGVLPNRGDYYGKSLSYKRTGENSFRFIAWGSVDAATRADTRNALIVAYVDGQWLVTPKGIVPEEELSETKSPVK